MKVIRGEFRRNDYDKDIIDQIIDNWSKQYERYLAELDRIEQTLNNQREQIESMKEFLSSLKKLNK